MNIIAFAATSHRHSINKQLLGFAASQMENAKVKLLDLNDYELPLYSEEKEIYGFPQKARDFLAEITNSDGILISFAEHNGSYTAAYKNLLDWCSRIEPRVFQNKPMVLLSTSPGALGANSVLTMAKTSAPYLDGIVKASLSIPSFYENFDLETQQLKNVELNKQLVEVLTHLNC